MRNLVVLSIVLTLTGCSKFNFKQNGVLSKNISSAMNQDGSIKPGSPELAAATDITQTSAVVSWSPDVSAGAGTPGSYTLSYGTSSSLVGATVVTGVMSPRTITGLQANTTYYYRVEAINPVGNAFSSILQFSTLPALPGIPTLGRTTVTSNSASVTWTAGVGGAASSFSVLYSTQADLAGALIIPGATSPTNITGLASGTAYYYAVRATNAAGSAISMTGSFTVSAAAPGAPVLGAVTPMQTSASIPWSAGVGGTPASYSLRYGTSSTLTGATAVATVTSPYNLTGLTAGRLYYYQVTATNATASVPSSISSFTTLALPVGAPVLGAVSGITQNGATLSWSAAAGTTPTSYDLSYATNAQLTGATVITGATSPRALTGLSANTTYYFRVTAKTGASSASSEGSFTTLIALPGAPVLGAVTPMQTSASIPWSAGSGGAVASYSLRYGTSSTLVGATNIASVTSPRSLSGLTASTTYYYQVTATNASGSTSSAISSFATLALPVGAPVLGAVTNITQTGATLSWSAAAGSTPTSYDLSYATNAQLTGATVITGATSPRALTGLSASTTYYYQVTAKTGASSASSTGSFTTLVAAPGVPVLGAVTPAQTSASIPWSAGNGGAVASYSLKYGTSSTLVGATTVAAVTSPYNLTGLTAGTLYYYQVIANNATASAPSSIGNFTTTALAVTAPVLGAVSGITQTGATLSWSAGSGGVPTSYDLAYATNAQLTGATVVTGVTSPRALTGLVAGTPYYFRITAKNASSSAPSATSSFTTLIAAPGAPVLGAVSPAQTSASVAWSAGAGGAVASYSLKYGTSSTLVGATTIASATSPYSITGLTSGATYYYQVTATNATGSASSAIASFVTVVGAPGAPTLGTPSSITTSGANLSWSAGSGGAPTSYSLQYGLDSALASPTTVASVTSPRALTGLTSNRTYYYRITATNSAGSANSAIGTFVTLVPAPSAPTLSAVTNITQTSASVSWSVPTNTSVTSFGTTLHPVMTNRCAGCHSTAPTQNGTTPHGSATASIAHNAMFFVDSMGRSKVNFTTPTLSRLYTKVMEGHQCGTSCAPEILTAINQWIAGGGGAFGPPATFKVKYATSASALTSSPTMISSAVSPQAITGLSAGTTYYYLVEATNTGGSTNSSSSSFVTTSSGGGGSTPIDFKTELLMADRRYVYETLVELFSLNTATERTSGTVAYQAYTNIFQRAQFGGACDIYAQVVGVGNAVENERERCFAGVTVSNKPNSNASRYSLATKACQSLVNDATAIGSIHTKIFGSSTAGAVNDANLLKAYQLFYPEESLPTNVKDALIAVGTSQGATTDAAKWKLIILGLCSSPEWQSLH